MDFPVNDILFVFLLVIFLAIIYRQILSQTDFFYPIKQRYLRFDRDIKINNYTRKIKKTPADIQKTMFKETLILLAVLTIMYLIATKSLFFTAVVSGSMSPTFDREDLVLMENIDRTYKVGDIIMFHRPDTNHPESHRIVTVTDKGIIRTAGDASGGQVDWWDLGEKDIIGKAIIINGKPIVIKGYGKPFIIDDKNQDFGPLGRDYRKYMLFFEVVKIYGYVIAMVSLLIYIALTVKQRPRAQLDKDLLGYER